MGLLDAFTGNWTDDPSQNAAIRQGLLSAAFGAMAGRGSRLQALGQGGMTGLMGYSNAMDRAQANEVRKLQTQGLQQGLQSGALQIEAQKRAAEKEAQLRALQQRFTLSPEQSALSGGGGPTVANAERVSASAPGFDFKGFAAALPGVDPMMALQMQQTLRKEQAKLSRLETMKDPSSGNLVNVALFEDGTSKVLPYGVKPDIVLQNMGNRVEAIDKNALPGGRSFALGVSPDAQLSANSAAAARAQAERHFQITQASGGQQYDPERGMIVNTRTGDARPVMSGGAPLGAKPKQAPESFSKGMTGVNELGRALDSYEQALKEAGGPDAMATGEKRAKLKGAFTALQMGLKNAFELGALAGPDVEILNGLLVDPTSFKAAALLRGGGINEQIAQARTYLGNREGALVNTYQIQNPDKSRRAPAAGKPSSGPAVGAVDGGFVFLGGDPADPKSWRKAQ